MSDPTPQRAITLETSRAVTLSPPDSAKAFEEKLLAIDLIDALRREEQRLDAALADSERMVVLRDEIKSYYAKAGITVSEATIDQAIAERQAQRYAFRPPSLGSVGRTLATLFIWRKPVAWVTAGVLTIGLAAGLSVTYREQALNRDFASAQQCLISAEANAGSGDANTLGALQAEGSALRGNGADRGKLDGWMTQASRTCEFFAQPMELHVTARKGEKTGVRRDFRGEARRQVSGYYIIADVVTPSGATTQALVTDVEHSAVHDVDRVGVRTTEAHYDALRRDKQDDGLISNRLIAQKPANSLQWQLADEYSSDFIVEW